MSLTAHPAHVPPPNGRGRMILYAQNDKFSQFLLPSLCSRFIFMPSFNRYIAEKYTLKIDFNYQHFQWYSNSPVVKVHAPLRSNSGSVCVDACELLRTVLNCTHLINCINNTPLALRYDGTWVQVLKLVIRPQIVGVHSSVGPHTDTYMHTQWTHRECKQQDPSVIAIRSKKMLATCPQLLAFPKKSYIRTHWGCYCSVIGE